MPGLFRRKTLLLLPGQLCQKTAHLLHPRRKDRTADIDTAGGGCQLAQSCFVEFCISGFTVSTFDFSSSAVRYGHRLVRRPQSHHGDGDGRGFELRRKFLEIAL